MTTPLHLAVALDGAGWHPAAWREPDARPADLLTAGYWVDLVRQAERGLLDFVTIEDALHLQAGDRTDRVQGRLDAVLIACRTAPLTSSIGIVPTVIATHTEPFHASKAIATLDWVSGGRAGVHVQVSIRDDDARHTGRREAPSAADATAEAADYVEVLRRLWDSWEDDAEIRDVATGRFVDRDRLHYIDFEGRWFTVKGPSITPRPPQGQPIVAANGHAEDLAFVTPRNRAHAAELVAAIGTGPLVLADLEVLLDDTEQAARERRQRLDDLAGGGVAPDATTFTGTAAQLADLLLDWQQAGLAGFRLRPAVLPHDLVQITDGLVPDLQRRGAFRTAYESATLRGHLGLPRPENRYAAAGATA